MKLQEWALWVAKKFKVQTPENGLVLFSVSYLETLENKQKAKNYAYSDPKRRKRLDDTPCGQKLIELGMEKPEFKISPEACREIWDIAGKRLVDQASGNVTAFVEGVDPRSTFVRVELPAILNNRLIVTVNFEDKFEFAKRFGIE